MGEVDGEVCCTRIHDGEMCGAAPWMPISELPCGEDGRRDDNTERNAAIVRAFEGGAKMKDIARDLGVCRETVGRVLGTVKGLSEYAVERRGKGRGPAITLEQVQAAIELQAQGSTWRQIGAALNRKPSVIKDAVREFRAGRGRLANQQSLSAEALAKVQARQAAGESLEDIASELGITYQFLTKRLRLADGAA